MRVFFDDWTDAVVPLAKLEGIAGGLMLAWSVDAYRRGVEVAMTDGRTTSFSAEFAKHPSDEGKDSSRRTISTLASVVATNTRTIREERGLSVAEVARRAGMAAPNVHRLEQALHNPTTTTLSRIADALEVSILRLVKPVANDAR